MQGRGNPPGKENQMLYVAYGSNLNKDQMAWRCPTAKAVGTNLLIGWRLSFKGSKTGSYLTIEPDPDGEVPVGIWEIDKESERALDAYEGYPVFYRKVKINVRLNGRNRKGIVYIMNDGRPYGIPSINYIETCITGYNDFGFDQAVLAEAFDYTCKKVKKTFK